MDENRLILFKFQGCETVTPFWRHLADGRAGGYAFGDKVQGRRRIGRRRLVLLNARISSTPNNERAIGTGLVGRFSTLPGINFGISSCHCPQGDQSQHSGDQKVQQSPESAGGTPSDYRGISEGMTHAHFF
jgi:hypothetical protein